MSDDNDNGSNQSTNSNDNYQAMPDEEEEEKKAHAVLVIPDLAPPVPHDIPPSGPPPDPGPPVHEPRLTISSNDAEPLYRTNDAGPQYQTQDYTNTPNPYMPPPAVVPGPVGAPVGGIGTTPPATTTPAPSEYLPAHTPSGAPMDEGFYVWLSHHGVVPGDATKKERLQEFKENYLSLPQADHNEYIQVGRANPGNYKFDLTAWQGVDGLPAPGTGTGTDPGDGHPHDPPLIGPDDPPYDPPDPGPQPIPEPMPIGTLPGEGGVPDDADGGGTGDLADLGLQRAQGTAYDWQGRRLGRRTWNSRLGRYV